MRVRCYPFLHDERLHEKATTMTASFDVHHWANDEYDQMVEAGVFGDHRVELLDGVVYDMSPQSRRHAAALRKARRVLVAVCPENCEVEVQMPLRLEPNSTLEPDLAIVPRDPEDYAEGHPTTALLVVEVADSSLRYDRIQKARAYARASIQDFWILNLIDNWLEVYRDPAEGTYRSRQVLRRGEQITALARPDRQIAVGDFLPPKV